MIISKKDYKAFLCADKKSLNVGNSIKSYLFNDVWRFQRYLRRMEYCINCKKNRFYTAFVKFKFQRLSRKLGFTIPPNVFGPGLSIAHRRTIVVNGGARIGANCRIHVCVNIGTEGGERSKAPIIGSNCYIGPGAKIYGDIQLGDNVAIGANAVVNKNFSEGSYTVGGVPARIISNKGSSSLIIHGYDVTQLRNRN